MADTDSKTVDTAPYASWLTFKRFVGELAKKSLPSRIDHTVMAGKSGSAKSTIRGALRFLGLTDADYTPTKEFRELVGAHGNDDEWKAVLEKIIMNSYGGIIGGLALDTGTAQQLADCFRKHGKVTGSTLTMAVRFFLAALDDAGVQRSPYFAAPPRPSKPQKQQERVQAQRTPPKADTELPESGSNTGVRDKPSSETTGYEWTSHPFYIPTRDQPVVVKAPRDLTEIEWALIDSFMRGTIKLAEQETPPPSADTENGG